MSPPQLARDTPVLNILKPVLVCSDVFVRIELQFTIEYRWKSDVCHVLHGEEPLLAETWLYCCVLIALRVAHLIIIILYVIHQTSLFEVDSYL